MNCKETRSLLSEFYDQDLNEEMRSLVEEHLGCCVDCQDEYESLKKILKVLKKLKTKEIPRDYMESLKKRGENRNF